MNESYWRKQAEKLNKENVEQATTNAELYVHYLLAVIMAIGGWVCFLILLLTS